MSRLEIFDGTISILERALSFASLRHNVIASNIANLNTPNYLARELPFQRELKEALAAMAKPEGLQRGPNPAVISTAFSEAEPKVVYEKALRTTNDGNSVDIDLEMKKLAENNLFYNVAIQLMARKLGIVKQSIG